MQKPASRRQGGKVTGIYKKSGWGIITTNKGKKYKYALDDIPYEFRHGTAITFTLGMIRLSALSGLIEAAVFLELDTRKPATVYFIADYRAKKKAQDNYFGSKNNEF